MPHTHTHLVTYENAYLCIDIKWSACSFDLFFWLFDVSNLCLPLYLCACKFTRHSGHTVYRCIACRPQRHWLLGSLPSLADWLPDWMAARFVAWRHLFIYFSLTSFIVVIHLFVCGVRLLATCPWHLTDCEFKCCRHVVNLHQARHIGTSVQHCNTALS